MDFLVILVKGLLYLIVGGYLIPTVIMVSFVMLMKTFFPKRYNEVIQKKMSANNLSQKEVEKNTLYLCFILGINLVFSLIVSIVVGVFCSPVIFIFLAYYFFTN